LDVWFAVLSLKEVYIPVERIQWHNLVHDRIELAMDAWSSGSVGSHNIIVIKRFLYQRALNQTFKVKNSNTISSSIFFLVMVVYSHVFPEEEKNAQ
jgi:hypothetical protein